MHTHSFRASRCSTPLSISLALMALTAGCQPPADDYQYDDAASEAVETAAGWSSTDVGGVAKKGTWSLSSGTHTLNGSGADIWGKADEFRFAYQPITGDTTITARVASLQRTNDWAKAVVMIRENLTPGSKYVAALLSPKAANLFRSQVRSATNGATVSGPGADPSVIPGWLRVSRNGSRFEVAYSKNGSTWVPVGAAVTVSMASTALVGIGVTSHADGTLAKAVVDNVKIGAVTHLCTAGQRRCSGKLVEICTPDGAAWAPGDACPFVCTAGSCTGTCAPGQARCNGNGVETCSTVGTWAPAQTCPFVCAAGSCAGQCVPGKTECTDGDTERTCSAAGVWQSRTCPVACAGLVQRCADCVPGDRHCDGNGLAICSATGTWTHEACPFTCAANNCTGLCVPGQRKCDGNTVSVCSAEGLWTQSQSCPFVCSAGQCSGQCVPGRTECAGPDAEQTCSPDGRWQQKTCAVACAGLLQRCAECIPGEQRCNGNVAQSCAPSTGTWDSRACPFACSNGTCVGTCVPGQRRCTGNDSDVCTAGGSWQTQFHCGMGCSNGDCNGIDVSPAGINFGSLSNGEETRQITVTVRGNVPLTISEEYTTPTGPGNIYLRRGSSCIGAGTLVSGASCTYTFGAFFDPDAPPTAMIYSTLTVKGTAANGSITTNTIGLAAWRP
jgi:hypothetical protein